MARTTAKSKLAPCQPTTPTAPATKPPSRKRKLTAKAKAQQKANKKNQESSDDSGSDVEDETKARTDIDWKNEPELSLELIRHVMENANIKQALFPAPGPNASTKDGGGKTKAHAYWLLCKLLLGDDEQYKEAIEKAENVAKERTCWSTKIKNRIRAMTKTTRKYITEMGETGAGIQSASEIDTSVSNAFTNKWAEISQDYPWFFDMRNLIAQRPNLVPTGVGHGSTAVDLGIIIPTPATTSATATGEAAREDDADIDDDRSSILLDGWDMSPSPRQSPEPDSETSKHKRSFSEIDELVGSGDDYEPSTHPDSEPIDEEETPAVENTKEDTKPAKTRPAKPSTSAPAASLRPAKKTKLADFNEIAKVEEKSRAKELEVAALRTRHMMKATEVKGRLAEKREERKREERMARHEMKMLKMRQQHEFRMARFGAATSSSSASRASTSQAASFFDGLSSSASHYASSEPTSDFNDNEYAPLENDHHDGDTFTASGVTGPSTTISISGTEFENFENYTLSADGVAFQPPHTN
ncbi:hypothetical protein C8R45DRAFT_1216264 [Mycena sanguinolenta]|nr:hypothetical protein C8R45DRAFT_1216264 [Mycena sanguinolenta]